MQQSTEITSHIDKIKHIDQCTIDAVNKAKGGMEDALTYAKDAGSCLNALKLCVGARRYNEILLHNFDDSFRNRAKAYRKSVNADTRQGLLCLGLVPDKNPTEATLIKTAPFFGWINKIHGHLRDLKTLQPAERIACKTLKKELDRLLGL